MATVTGVTQETGVTMEIASQRAIFETSEEKHAPSLIATCVNARCVSVLHVCAHNETPTVSWPLFTLHAIHFTM